MSRIDELIEELCPKGIPKLQLNELVTFEKGAHLSDDDFQPGVYPVVTASRSESRRHAFSNVGPKAVTVTSHGAYAGHVNFWEDAIWLAGNVFLLRPNLQMVSEKFLFYALKNSEETIQGRARGGGIPYMNSSDLKGLMFPIPPLEVQREIVSILDKFTQLEAELEAELEARRIQYEVTRDRLLDFSDDLAGHAPVQKIPNLRPSGIESFELSELGELFSGLSGKSKGDFSDGNSPFVSYLDIGNNSSLPREIKTKVRVGPQERQNEVCQGDLLFTGSSEDREGVGLTAEVEYSPSEPTYLNSFCFGFRPKEGAFAIGYLKHLFRSTTVRTQVKACSNGVTRINISKKSLVKIEIPVPPLEVQANIALILDKLDALVNDITIGLPAEIAARRKQYEYCRNKLLTFKELEAA